MKMCDPFSVQLIKQVTWCIVPYRTIFTKLETSRLQYTIEMIATHPIEVMLPEICVVIKQIASNIFLHIILLHNHKNCLNKKSVIIHLFYQNLESLMIRECQKSLTNVTVAHLYMQNMGNENKLTNCGLRTAFGDIWLRYWLDVWRQYALTWTIVYELSGRSLGAISPEMIKISVLDMSLEIVSATDRNIINHKILKLQSCMVMRHLFDEV